MNVATLSGRIGLRDEQLIGKAQELMRLSSVKVPGGLGQGEVCKAAICLELACASLPHVQAPGRELFIRHGCTTKKVYDSTYGLLQKALGMSAAPPSISDVAIKSGCEPLCKPAEALMAVYRARLNAKLSVAHGNGASSASSSRNDSSSPAFNVAALHLTGAKQGWKKSKVKLELKKVFKALSITPAQFKQAVDSITELCSDLVGPDKSDQQEGGEQLEDGGEGKKAGIRKKRAHDGDMWDTSQMLGKKKARKNKDTDADPNGTGLGEFDEVDGVGEQVDVKLSTKQTVQRKKAGSRRKRQKTDSDEQEEDSEHDECDADDDEQWEVVGRAGESQRPSIGRQRSTRSTRKTGQ